METRDDVDPARIGIVGWSLGGYHALRAAAFEERFALCVAWGANHNWGAVQRRRLEREGERPVPHYWEHVLWVLGHDDLDTFIEFADDVHLDGVVDPVTERDGSVTPRTRVPKSRCTASAPRALPSAVVPDQSGCSTLTSRNGTTR